MTNDKPRSITRAQRLVTQHFGVSVEQLLGEGRFPEVVIARHVAMYLEREICDLSFPAIGRLYYRDHSTVHAAYNHVADRVKANDPRYTSHVKKLASQLDIAILSEEAALRSARKTEIYCPTCGSAVVQDLRRQLNELQEQVKLLQKGEVHERGTATAVTG